MLTEHDVDLLVVRFLGDISHDLVGETNADSQDTGWQRGEQAVVKSAAAAETEALGGEGEAGNENERRFARIDGRAFGGVGLHYPEGAGFQLARMADGMEDEIFAVHARKQHGLFFRPFQWTQVGLAGQRGVGGDDPRILPAGEAGDTLADAFRCGCHGRGRHPGELRAYQAAEFGFGGHEDDQVER